MFFQELAVLYLKVFITKCLVSPSMKLYDFIPSF